MTSTHRKRVLFLFLVAVTCIAGFSALLILHAPTRHFILDPIISALQSIRYVLGYASQGIKWAVALLLVALIAAVYVVRSLPTPRAEWLHRTRSPFSEEGPAMHLAQILERAPRRRFGRQGAILELRDIATRALAYRFGLPVDAARDLLDSGEWTDDESLQEMLSFDKHRMGERKYKTFIEQVNHALAYIERIVQEV